MWLLVPCAHALTIEGSQLALGVHGDGSLGDEAGELGLLYDPPGDTPMGSDLILPGRAWEVWAVSHGGGAWTALGTEGAGPELSWTELSGPDVRAWVGQAGDDELSLSWRIELPVDGSAALLRLTLEGAGELDDVQVMRAIDVDVDADFGSYSTANGADGELAWAGSEVTGKTLALLVEGGEGGICAGWCSSPDEVLAGSVGELTGDRVIGAAVELGPLGAGEPAEVAFAYGLGLDLADAERAARELLELDLDGDGVPEDVDCSPYDASIHPGALELPDGLDQDCDGSVDEDTSSSDDDGDGFSEAEGDCDDADPSTQDCPDGERWDESSLRWTETESADCSHAPAMGGLLLALLALARRRR
jgi:hypothetical protein